MSILSCYVDDETLATLRHIAAQTGRTVEDLAEAAISEAALDERRKNPGAAGPAIPTDEDFDNVDHALGRPTGPGEVYRNRFVIAVDSDRARRFQLLGWWTMAGKINGDRDGWFTVNEAGKAALAERKGWPTDPPPFPEGR